MDLDEISITVTHWPFDSPLALAHAYTLYATRQPRPSDDPANALHPINRQMADNLPGLTRFRGNILVVKHEKDGPPTHIVDADLEIVHDIFFDSSTGATYRPISSYD
ncbi:hypothetical protein B0H15DRAFT_948922 [Mycena belliarum]|uniref:Uncharacterized protein n=1 Tax=Mycena belliarum TaxID=1033014 RepID=A0AAD6U9N5_9AGAR|nr:hypothetical protein B0H15DRAFT_948922 [Mycena belliae]